MGLGADLDKRKLFLWAEEHHRSLFVTTWTGITFGIKTLLPEFGGFSVYVCVFSLRMWARPHVCVQKNSIEGTWFLKRGFGVSDAKYSSVGPCIVLSFLQYFYYFYSITNQIYQCIKFILFWNDTLHVSGGLSVRHQEFKTVHTATGICQSKQTAVSVSHMPVAVCTVLNSWWRTERPSETCTVLLQ
jgi:hypothetical protein